nr:MAG: replication associated protein [Cressdnaviricota sp.]
MSNSPHDNSQLALRSRDWCFTFNNYKPTDEALLQQLNSKYLVYGREVAPETGTPHLQGYIYFENQKFGHQLAKLLPRGIRFFKRMAPKLDSAIEYCKKDGDFHEQGDRPANQEEKGRRGKEAASWAIKKARSGDLKAVEEEEPRIYLQYGLRLESLHNPKKQPIDGALEHEWWVGSTGTGKSKLLWELYPGHFQKKKNKWWDGYRHEEIVAIEEWAPDNKHTAANLKEWADRYPFAGEIKGGVKQGLRPRKIIVISNYTIEQCFDRREDWEPMNRKFKVIRFPEDKQVARFRSQLQPIQASLGELEEISDSDGVTSTDAILGEDDQDGILDLPTWNWQSLFEDDCSLGPLA